MVTARIYENMTSQDVFGVGLQSKANLSWGRAPRVNKFERSGGGQMSKFENRDPPVNRQMGLKTLPSRKLRVRAVKISGTLLTVVGGSLANFSIKALCINCGFPSKNLPQPATNNVSPETESRSCCFNA